MPKAANQRTSPSRKRPTRRKGDGAFPPTDPQAYWNRVQRPLQCLIFLLPFILFYELGVLYLSSTAWGGADVHNRARLLLSVFFEWFGVTGYYLPGVIVVAVLLSWHFVRKDPWKVDAVLYPAMLAEALALALPLLAFSKVLALEGVTASSPGVGAAGGWQGDLVFSVGAGVYEEMLFRLILIAALHLFLVDYLALPEQVGEWLAVGLPVLAFVWYHFDERTNPFTIGRSFFYLVAGAYFTAIYLLRGIGIAAGCHALFDVAVVMLNWRVGEGGV